MLFYFQLYPHVFVFITYYKTLLIKCDTAVTANVEIIPQLTAESTCSLCSQLNVHSSHCTHTYIHKYMYIRLLTATLASYFYCYSVNTDITVLFPYQSSPYSSS